MKKWQWLLGLWLVVQADVASSILIGVGLNFYQGIHSLWTYIFTFAFCVIAPDLDIFLEIFKGNSGKVDSKHREGSHYPLLVIPITFIYLVIITSKVWAYAGSLCLLAHYIHDSFDEGGIMWLAPFTKKSYQFGINRYGPFITVLAQGKKINIPLEEWIKKDHLRLGVSTIAGTLYFLTAFMFFLYFG